MYVRSARTVVIVKEFLFCWPLCTTVHHCNTVEPLFSEESVTCNQRYNLCTDGKPAVLGACKGGGSFVLSLVWRILASGGFQKSWLLW